MERKRRLNHVIKRFYKIEIRYPELLVEWDYELNKVVPEEITYLSNKKYYWKCLKGHPSFLDTIGHRINGRGCPVCSGHKVVSGINDLKTLYPEIAANMLSQRYLNVVKKTYKMETHL